MCVVSMVSDFYNEDWRRRQPDPVHIPTTFPQVAPVALPWDKKSLELLEQIMKMLKKLDEKLGLPDCEDPAKQMWLDGIKKKVKRKKRKASK